MIRQIATLLSGNALSQIVNVVTILFVVTAYISPAEFGRYAVVMSYVGILSTIACLRYELAIVSTRRTRVANNMVFLCLVVATAFAVLVLFLFQVAELLVGDAFLLGASSLMIVALIYLKAIDQVCAAVLYRNEAYLTYSILKLIQALVLFAGFMVVGVMGQGLQGLLYSTVCAYATFALAGAIVVRRYGVRSGVEIDRMVAMSRKHGDFVKFNMPQALIDNLLTNGLNFVLVALAGPTVTGYFNYMQRVLRAPLGLIFGAVSQVVFRFSAKNVTRPGLVTEKMRQILAIVVVILVGAIIAVLLVHAYFPELAFLRDWVGMREYMIAFAVWMLVPYLFSPFATLPVVYDRQKTFFKLATMFNVCSLALLAVIIWKGTVVAAFWVVALMSLVYFSGLNVWVFGVARGGR
jgi:O-antigen/teichoic acid export membrane protein